MDELRAEIYKIITNREMAPEAQLFINMTKRKIKGIYDSQYILDSTMEEYIETQFEAIKPQLKRIKENKDAIDFEIINGVITNIGIKAQEVSQNAKAFDQEPESDEHVIEKGKQRLSEVSMKKGSEKTAKDLIVLMTDVIEDIRNKGNRRELLDQIKTEELNYSISLLRNHINAQMPQELIASFEKDNQKLIKQVAEKFEQYVNLEKDDKQKETFWEELNAGISLEQQSQNAKVFMDKQEGQNEESKKDRPKALPDDVLK